jgi:flagellar protein FlaG
MALNPISLTGNPNAAKLPASPPPSGGAPASVAPKGPAVVPEPASQQQQPPTAAQVQQAVESMRQMVEAKAPNSLSFSVDDTSGKTIVKISDAKTGETIRQIPSEELLDIARSLDKLQGMLLNQTA